MEPVIELNLVLRTGNQSHFVWCVDACNEWSGVDLAIFAGYGLEGLSHVANSERCSTVLFVYINLPFSL